MAGTILVAYATKHGSTAEVAEAVAAVLREHGCDVDVRKASDVRHLAGVERVILGAPLYSGRWHRHAHHFLARNKAALETLPVAVFALGPRSPEEEGGWPRCRAQLDRALAKVSWLAPVAVGLFGGVDPPKKGRQPRDQRDWQAIRAWAAGLAD